MNIPYSGDQNALLQLVLDCAQGQSVLLGPHIRIKINYTFLRKRDKKFCANLLIEAPRHIPIFQESSLHTVKAPIESAKNFLDVNDDIKQAASSTSQHGVEGANGVNNAQTQPVHRLSEHNALLQASEASNASDIVIVKSNRAGILKLSKVATTMKDQRHELAIEKPLANEAAAKDFIYEDMITDENYHPQSVPEVASLSNDVKSKTEDMA